MDLMKAFDEVNVINYPIRNRLCDSVSSVRDILQDNMRISTLKMDVPFYIELGRGQMFKTPWVKLIYHESFSKDNFTGDVVDTIIKRQKAVHEVYNDVQTILYDSDYYPFVIKCYNEWNYIDISENPKYTESLQTLYLSVVSKIIREQLSEAEFYPMKLGNSVFVVTSKNITHLLLMFTPAFVQQFNGGIYRRDLDKVNILDYAKLSFPSFMLSYIYLLKHVFGMPENSLVSKHIITSFYNLLGEKNMLPYFKSEGSLTQNLNTTALKTIQLLTANNNKNKTDNKKTTNNSSSDITFGTIDRATLKKYSICEIPLSVLINNPQRANIIKSADGHRFIYITPDIPLHVLGYTLKMQDIVGIVLDSSFIMTLILSDTCQVADTVLPLIQDGLTDMLGYTVEIIQQEY